MMTHTEPMTEPYTLFMTAIGFGKRTRGVVGLLAYKAFCPWADVWFWTTEETANSLDVLT